MNPLHSCPPMRNRGIAFKTLQHRFGKCAELHANRLGPPPFVQRVRPQQLAPGFCATYPVLAG